MDALTLGKFLSPILTVTTVWNTGETGHINRPHFFLNKFRKKSLKLHTRFSNIFLFYSFITYFYTTIPIYPPMATPLFYLFEFIYLFCTIFLLKHITMDYSRTTFWSDSCCENRLRCMSVAEGSASCVRN